MWSFPERPIFHNFVSDNNFSEIYMKVIIDNKIPYIKGVIETLADEVVYLPGKDITPDVVKDADALIIRTRTHCDRGLLQGSKVKFIGTATIGYDHIDTAYCNEAGIVWHNCPGCNAGAVEQYVHSALLLLQKEKKCNLKDTCLGVVGVGHVGSRVAQMAEALGVKVLKNDPPLADKGGRGFVGIEEIARKCDIISFHTPLVREGCYKTFHLADADFFASLRNTPYIINTSRGEVVDTQAILSALSNKHIAGAIIDVWENEPNINRELLHEAFIGTPHIAGYSADGKANATRMVLSAFCDFFHLKSDFQIVLPKAEPVSGKDSNACQLQKYNPQTDSERLKSHPEMFEQLRGDYLLRRE